MLLVLGTGISFSQAPAATDAGGDSAFSTIDETSIVLTDSSASDSGGNTLSAVTAANGIWVFVRMVLVLAIVVAIIWFMFKFLRKKTGTEEDTDDPFLRKVASVQLAPGKSVQIVTLIDKAYILGVSDDSVNLISEVDNAELIQDMNLYSDKNKGTKKPRNFDELLEIFMPRKKSSSGSSGSGSGTKTVYDDGSTNRLIDSLKNKHLSSSDEENI